LELRGALIDRLDHYYMADERDNILRPLCNMGGKAALEIDCGYGTVTRYLGERCSRVTAVAYAECHAEITRERTRDLGNIEVTLGLDSVFERNDKFDIVTLIDPFPCPSTRMAAGFSSNIADLLHQIKLRINESGLLVFAVHNRLGLQNFASCSNLESETPIVDIERWCSNETYGALGRQELIDILCQAGYESLEFSYPFPNHRLARTIITDKGASNCFGDLGEMIASACEHKNDKLRNAYYMLFEQSLIWPYISKNGLIPGLSNSFLVYASIKEKTIHLPKRNTLAFHFRNMGDRSRRCQVEFQLVDENQVVLHESPLDAYSDSPTEQSSHRGIECIHSNFVKGPLLVSRIISIFRADSWSFDQIVRAFQLYRDGVLALSGSCIHRPSLTLYGADFACPSSFIDLTLWNIVETHDGLLSPIDLGPDLGEFFPFSFLLFRNFRGLNSIVRRFGKCSDRRVVCWRDLIWEVYRGLDLPLSTKSIEDMWESDNMYLTRQGVRVESTSAMDFLDCILHDSSQLQLLMQMADRARNEAHQARLDADEAKLDAYQAREEADQARLDAYQARKEADQAKLDAHQARLNEFYIRNSNSWKYTSWMRQVKDYFIDT
jgi:SAM-dependent methyltransferase